MTEITPEQIEARRRHFIRSSRIRPDHKGDAGFHIVAVCGLVFTLFVIAAAIVGLV